MVQIIFVQYLLKYANFLICNLFQPSDNCVSGLGQFGHTVTCTRTDGKEPVSEHW